MEVETIKSHVGMSLNFVRLKDVINFLETSKDNLRQELNINLFDSLIQKAFKGELV
jgi:hypothetical protein